jgi:16S rRNA (guanine(966)-N(2))-methyltransferase RsmD
MKTVVKAAQQLAPRATGRKANRVRIGGGAWRSRVLEFAEVPGLRPTGDRVKQTAFNWLGQSLHGKTCLDAFAGSGALGFEAASRGADGVILCETDAAATTFLRQNAERLAAEQCKIVAIDVFSWLKTNTTKFDVVFCDPPFASDKHRLFLAAIAPHLAPQALVYVEAASPLEALTNPDGAFAILKTSRAGAVYFGLLHLKSAR